ncbi:MAG: 5-oxoprolinase subunit B family protein [Phycisphaerales bacterium]
MMRLETAWTSERSFLIYSPEGPLSAATLRDMTQFLRTLNLAGIRSIIPAPGGTLITLHSKCEHAVDPARLLELVGNGLIPSSIESHSTETRLIPICYHESLGLDVRQIAAHAGCSVDEVIELHLGRTYSVKSIGFSPGFAYLTEVDERLRTPRRSSPRARLRAGSVGIAEEMTAVYPSAGAGGWHIIGASPCRMFDPHVDSPSLLRVGDRVRFERIDLDAYEQMVADSKNRQRQ